MVVVVDRVDKDSIGLRFLRVGLGGRIGTRGPRIPSAVLYHAELHPVDMTKRTRG